MGCDGNPDGQTGPAVGTSGSGRPESSGLRRRGPAPHVDERGVRPAARTGVPEVQLRFLRAFDRIPRHAVWLPRVLPGEPYAIDASGMTPAATDGRLELTDDWIHVGRWPGAHDRAPDRAVPAGGRGQARILR